MKSKLYFIPMFCLITFIYSCINTNAYLKSTNPNVSWLKNSKKEYKLKVLPDKFKYCDDKYLYCYNNLKSRAKNPIPTFFQIDKNSFDLVKSSNDVYKDKLHYIIELLWNEKAGWILDGDFTDKKHVVYSAIPISFDGKGNKKKLFTLDIEKKEKQVKGDFMINNDSTKVTYYSSIYLGKENKLTFMAKCFDFISMNLLWEHEYEFPYEVKSMSEASNIEYIVNNNGEPQFLVKSYFDKRKEVRKVDGVKEANYMFKFFILNQEGKVDEYDIDTKGYFVKSIEFPFSKSLNPIICAYTFQNKNFRELQGIIFKMVNTQTKKVVDLKEIKLHTKKLTAYNPDTKEEIKQPDRYERVENLKIIDVITTEDRSVYVLGEIKYTITICTKSKYGETCKTYFIGGNILVTKIGKDGNESWSKIIPKEQYVNTEQILGRYYDGIPHSFKAFPIGNNVHLFFNDHEKNYKESSLTKVKTWNGIKTSFIHLIIKPNGVYEVIETMNKKDHPLLVEINSIQKIDESTIFFRDWTTLGKLKIDLE